MFTYISKFVANTTLETMEAICVSKDRTFAMKMVKAASDYAANVIFEDFAREIIADLGENPEQIVLILRK